MIADENIELLKQNPDPLVQELLESFLLYHESPRAESYLLLYDRLSAWAEELKEDPLSFRIKTAEDKAFDRSHKISTSIRGLLDDMDDIRENMTTSQKDIVENSKIAKKMSKSKQIVIG